MSKFCLIHILIISLLNNFVFNEEVIENPISVQTKSGQINGFTETFDGKVVNVFLGIPYADPPVGKHRFTKPDPVTEWTQPLNANKWPNNCYQIKSDLLNYKSDVFSEDCLYLNIWSPNTKLELKDSPRPVIVFIHGGAFYSGTSSVPDHDGKVLSALGDVIFVTLNYRLDAFGFLYADSDEAPGNVGLWDQNMALQWVNDNIEYFGGNPKNITLMGQSTGAWSVSLHIMSQHSQHLFQNAILTSGAAYSHRIERDAENMKKHWLNAAISIGCAEDQEYSYVDFTPQIIQCLKTASPEKILQLCTELELSVPKLAWDRLVVIDGQFLSDKPIDVLSDLHLNETKNILIGTNEDEGSIFLALLYDQDKFNLNSPKNMTLKEAFQELSTISSYFPTNLQVIGDEVSELYFHAMKDDSEYSEIRHRIGQAFGDFYFQCPTMRFAEMLFSENMDFVKVYQFYLTSYIDVFKSSWITKASHGSETYFISGIPLLSHEYSERQKEVSKQMIEMISHFAKHGYPNNQNGLKLKPYYAITDRVVKPYFEFSDKPKPNNNFGMGFKLLECDYLWNEYLDY